MTNRASHRLSFVKKIVLAAPVVSGLLHAPPFHAQTSGSRPAFDVASIKLNTSGCINGRGGGSGPSPGRLSVKCVSIRTLIESAYGTFANGPIPDRKPLVITGAPGWVDSDAWDISAKPSGNASIDQMYGPMLQMLLEDRFRLKVHRETRESPVYALTVARSGLKLSASREGSCIPLDMNHMPPQPAPGQPPPAFCGRMAMKVKGGKTIIDAYGVSMGHFAGVTLPRLDLDRTVLDKTGLTGLFDLHLEFDASGTKPGLTDLDIPDAAAQPDNTANPSIFTALREQLGLRLSPDKGPVAVLLVEHVEKPSGN